MGWVTCVELPRLRGAGKGGKGGGQTRQPPYQQTAVRGVRKAQTKSERVPNVGGLGLLLSPLRGISGALQLEWSDCCGR